MSTILRIAVLTILFWVGVPELLAIP